MPQAPHQYSFGIIGHPLVHSLSPALHNWIYTQMGIDAHYEAWDIAPDQLADFILKMREKPINGLSVTFPHKQAVIPYIDGRDELAKAVGAVNTLYLKNGLIIGANTDVSGFIQPLQRKAFVPKIALVLGAGGAARAVMAGINSLNKECDIFISSRDMHKANDLADDFMAIPIAWEKRSSVQANLIVNATPMGMSGSNTQKETALTGSDFKKILPSDGTGLVYDLVYNPLVTPFLKAAKETPCQMQDGLDMLFGQGMAQIKLWTGKTKLPKLKDVRKMLTEKKLVGRA